MHFLKMLARIRREYLKIGAVHLSLVSLFANIAVADAGGSDNTSGDPTVTSQYRIEERGQDFGLYRKVSTITNSFGIPHSETNQFTLLENALHYQDSATGEWRESEDVIESFADGAIARRGPHKAIFAIELNCQSVFDIQAADGKRLRGGVRAIQLTEASTGRTTTIGTVKNSVTARLLPPNSVVWADAFDGLKADVVINWKHQGWSQDVLLREAPELPPGWNAATTRLEVLTEFIVDAEPSLRQGDAQAGALGHSVIDFGAMALLVGKAFPVQENATFAMGGDLRHEGAPVHKHWQRTDDGRHFLIESLDWNTSSQAMKDLPVRRQASNGVGGKKSYARAWPASPPVLKRRKPIQLASADYSPRGYVFDFLTISGSTPGTLSSGQTYYIKTSYYSGNNLTVQAGAIVKFKNNAYMLLYGTMSFPSSGANPIFTSRNDDSAGDRIESVASEDDSNGDPTLHRANPALWIYYDQKNVTVQNTQFRWAKGGIKIDYNTGDAATQTIANCFFKNITGTGSYGISGGNPYKVSTSSLRKCKVDTSGVTMTLDCSGSIADENLWPGDSSWQLTNPAGQIDSRFQVFTSTWPADDNSQYPEIEGFASSTSVNAGGSIAFYVDVRTGSSKNYKIEFYRMGWYNGVGARKMAWIDNGTSMNSITKTSLSPQLVPPIDATHGGVIDCLAYNANNEQYWTLARAGYSLNVPSWWLSGVYVAKLTEVVTLKQSYIIFTVREDSRGSDLLVQSSVTTWQAYNPWGGGDLYPYPTVACGLDCDFCYPTKVSFNRPYAGATCIKDGFIYNLNYGTGAGEFFVQTGQIAGPGWEYNAVRWLESQGYDATYCTSVDIHAGPLWKTSKPIKAFLSLGHDEYWSSGGYGTLETTGMRSNVEAARDDSTHPVNVIFLASNVCFRRIHFDSGLRSFTCDKTLNNDGESKDLWRGAQHSPEVSLVGVEYVYNSLYDKNVLVQIPPGGHWAFTGTGLNNPGDQATLTGLLGYEVDGCWLNSDCTGTFPTCPDVNTTKLGDSPFNHEWDEQCDNQTPPNCVHHICAGGHSYVTIYTTGDGAQVFATGSMNWIWGLDDFGYTTCSFAPSRVNGIAKKMTDNVIKRFTGH